MFPKDAEFICVYGWDEELYNEALKDHRPFAFVTEEERTSSSSHIQIYHLQTPLQIEPLAKKIAWSAVFKNVHLICENQTFKTHFEQCHMAASLIVSETADFGVEALKNAKANQGSYRRGMDLKGAFAGIPALIVGAGPSLKKNGPLIRQFEKKALIFAGGSALNSIDVEPHFAASIDAAAPYQQFKTHPFPETPFCYQARMNRDNFSLIHGEKLLFPDSSSDLINWMYGEEAFDGGWTVGNFLTAIAIHFGCSPIYFVGMDFCYAQDRKYAEVEVQELNGVRVGDFLTQRDWVMAASWMEGKGINATEGGMLGGPQESLANALKQCTKEWNLREMVWTAIQNIPLRTICNEPLKEDVIHEKLLMPLWHIWKPLLEREAKGQNLELHQSLFFQRIREEHGLVL